MDGSIAYDPEEPAIRQALGDLLCLRIRVRTDQGQDTLWPTLGVAQKVEP